MARRRLDDVVVSIRQRVATGLHLGLLKKGDRLPSIREMSRMLHVGQRVVLAAYRRLELERLVSLRPKSGIYVAPGFDPRATILPSTCAWLPEILAKGLSLGITVPEFSDWMRACFDARHLRAVCVECNADQLDWLRLELQCDYGFTTTGVAIDELADHSKDIARADLLVTTFFHKDQLERAAAALNRPVIAITLRTEFVATMARHLGEGPVYVVVTDPRFAGKLKMILGSVPGTENLRTVIVGRDDVGQIPEGARIYMMKGARDRLAHLPLTSQVPSLPRVFSPESAREILTFIMRSNMAAVGTTTRRAARRPD